MAMTVLLKRVLFVAVPLVLVLVVSAAAATTPSRKLEHAKRPIVAIAMDGPRVAYSTDQNAVFVWNVLTGKTTRARAVHLGTGASIPQLAVAGTRVAWILTHVAGNSEETNAQLMTSSPTGSGRHVVGTAFRTDGYDDSDGVQMWDGTWLTGLAGSGNVLAVSRWTTQHNAVSNERLSVIDSKGHLRVIASGPGTIASAGVDAGRIAVLRSNGTVGMYSPAGRLLLEVTPSSAQEIALGGGKLVVLTKTKTIEVYDSASGVLRHVWQLPIARAGNLCAYGRIGVYSAPFGYSARYMHVIDLLTGREFVLPNANRPLVPAAVGRLGLVYAVNGLHYYGPHPARTAIVFLSTAKVLAKLGD